MADQIDPAMRDRLLKDTAVQAALQQAGKLDDRAVQQAMINAANRTFTAENAALVQAKLKDWAEDPEVQAKARHYAGMAMVMAGTAGASVIGVIEQGPAGVQLVAFCAGLASLACTAFTLINILSLITNLTVYAVAVYQAVFAITTMIFEAKPEWIQKVSGLDKYQDKLITYCSFLTTSAGRGLFYMFQGSLWLLEFDLTSLPGLLKLGTGAAQILVGFLNVLMHFGIMPQHLAAKARAASDGYKTVSTA